MPKNIAVGVVTSDKMAKSRRVEIARLVKHAKYGKFCVARRFATCTTRQKKSHVGDTVEIVECPPQSKPSAGSWCAW